MRGDRGQHIGGAADVDVIEIPAGCAADGPGCVNDSGAAGHQLAQRAGVVKVALDQAGALAGEVLRPGGGPGQDADEIASLQQARTQRGADKPRGTGNRDQAAAWNQADATLRRNSSVTAFRLSASWELMKSRRALARDSLPEEVLGRVWGGTSST